MSKEALIIKIIVYAQSLTELLEVFGGIFCKLQQFILWH